VVVEDVVVESPGSVVVDALVNVVVVVDDVVVVVVWAMSRAITVTTAPQFSIVPAAGR
jgi:hypothetical protein